MVTFTFYFINDFTNYMSILTGVPVNIPEEMMQEYVMTARFLDNLVKESGLGNENKEDELYNQIKRIEGVIACVLDASCFLLATAMCGQATSAVLISELRHIACLVCLLLCFMPSSFREGES